ncbi:pyridoxal-phosphate dependent enzyme [Flavobacterium sp. SUN052]|uniref:1-aminocyclopropane-1-carboxylate deaminase/D-cysteine desulfhydrase n=1 Tax=Flavobacterium sp. SUN052 TaxID=3002441 RepID=UPI00237D9AC9|nr:pyridoxal-phosphate dependent enzyme [Flavobacterium sp. SUN052]MEC4004767.1 pyridoxal-phosphate dependent enzyme [Flavobacterium sp. SUN052]
MEVLTQEIQLKNTSIRLFIKREDLIHPFISGNKFRKLKYNLIQAKEENHSTLVTFGGAFSNHIAATAYAGKENGFKTIGIIRGEELESKIADNPTLLFARECGMKFVFVTRENYKIKDSSDFLSQLRYDFGDFYLIPEGGTNNQAIKGCEEILNDDDVKYDYVCCSVGTGGTISGIINKSIIEQNILGFPSLKGDFLQKDICKFATKQNWKLITDYHFGGYGKVSDELILFINVFFKKYKIPLDPIYTGKMVFGVIDLINKNYFPEDSKILLIHTGGIQGVQGMNNKLINKNLETIKFDV